MYKHYGDAAIVQKHYSGVKAWIDYLTSRAQQSGLANMYYYYGDWVTHSPVTYLAYTILGSSSPRDGNQ